jgi:hypothetical protein
MKTIIRPKKLRIAKEILRSLVAVDLEKANGGFITNTLTGPSCYRTRCDTCTIVG